MTHPAQMCGLCGAPLGPHDGYVTLAPNGALFYCDDWVCMETAELITNKVEVQP